MSKKRNPSRCAITVTLNPALDQDIRTWADAQASISTSLRCAIRKLIRETGNVDYVTYCFTVSDPAETEPEQKILPKPARRGRPKRAQAKTENVLKCETDTEENSISSVSEESKSTSTPEEKADAVYEAMPQVTETAFDEDTDEEETFNFDDMAAGI